MRLECPRCSNFDQNYFYFLNGKLFCRKCIGYVGEIVKKKYLINPGYYKLDYKLTKIQQEASDFVLKNIIEGKTCAINAVCGAGKTEIIYDSLKYCLNNNLKIGIAIPRKDVVIELKERISRDFNVKVVAVYGGNHDELVGDIIIFTTHQAFRYINHFDILIIDEVDAFPFSNNDILKGIVKNCSKNFVYLSATMPKYIENNTLIEKFYLNKRYHGYDIPIPKCIECFNMLFRLKLILKRYKEKLVLIYFPTIKLEEKISKKIKFDYIVNSRMDDRKDVLIKIKNLNKGIVLTTTVLERGITIKDVQVIVFNAEHKLFKTDVLIQISGRVGRNKMYPNGDVVFICKNKNKNIKAAIRTIKKCNE